MVSKEIRMTSTSSPGWKLPFNLAVLLHIILFLSALLLPKYLHKNRTIQDTYTVDLIAIAELPATATSEPAPPAVKTPPQKEVATKKAAPITPAITKAVQIKPVPVISINPLKRKLKHKNSPDLLAQQAREQKEKQHALQQQLLAEARRQQAVADAEAKIAANEAVKALKQMLLADAAVASSIKARNQSSARSSRNTTNAMESQYQANIAGRLHQFWALPDIKAWDSDLTAVVIIVISQNGQILNHSFEKRSGDRVFDQFVTRTIQDANPLPPIPGALKRQQYTIGLHFKPGEIL
jgi:colicin import membrane protein